MCACCLCRDEHQLEWEEKVRQREAKQREAERARQELETRQRIAARVRARLEQADAEEKDLEKGLSCVCVHVCVNILWIQKYTVSGYTQQQHTDCSKKSQSLFDR